MVLVQLPELGVLCDEAALEDGGRGAREQRGVGGEVGVLKCKRSGNKPKDGERKLDTVLRLRGLDGVTHCKESLPDTFQTARNERTG